MTKIELLDKIVFGDCSLELDGERVEYGTLARYLFNDVNWFFDKQEGSYQGDWYMVGKKGEDYYFFTMSYGSCSGCDWIEALSYGSEFNDNGDKRKNEMGKLIDEILATPVLKGKEAALEYARKFDWQGSYDRDENNPFVNEVIKAIEAN